MREGRHIQTYRTGSSFIRVMRGSEGPKHDPYAYTEIEIVPNDIRKADKRPKVTLHAGLAFWLQIGQGRKEVFGNINGEARLVLQFERHLGCSLAAFEKACQRVRSRCRICGGKPEQEVAGYPGESFLLCAQGHVMDSDFDEGAII